MSIVATPPTNFPRRINMYVPAMQYASDVNMYNATRVSFQAPAAAVSNNILNAQSVAAAVTVDLTANVNAQNILDPYGRTIQLVGVAGAVITTTTSAASAAGVNTITVTSPAGMLVGQPIANTTVPASIINGTTITAINGSVLTLSNAVVAPGVGSGTLSGRQWVEPARCVVQTILVSPSQPAWASMARLLSRPRRRSSMSIA